MGKSTISMAIFNSYVSHYQRVSHEKPWKASADSRQPAVFSHVAVSPVSQDFQGLREVRRHAVLDAKL